MSLKLKIVSPEKIEYLGFADRVLVPGTAGMFEILINHAPIISSLEQGDVEFSYQGEVKKLHIQGGFVEVQKNEVCLCVEMQ
jgi:F-type H+-transporting ATPase subunit epsilon